MTESQSKRSPAFLIVHGTWAQRAAWTRPDGTLRRRLGGTRATDHEPSWITAAPQTAGFRRTSKPYFWSLERTRAPSSVAATLDPNNLGSVKTINCAGSGYGSGCMPQSVGSSLPLSRALCTHNFRPCPRPSTTFKVFPVSDVACPTAVSKPYSFAIVVTAPIN